MAGHRVGEPPRRTMAIVDYAGPRGALPIERAVKLDARRYAFQAKRDGVYVKLTTDAHGRIADLVYRSGAAVGKRDSDGLRGVAIGLPFSTLHGELEAQTEAGIAARERRGEAWVHLFDVSVVGGVSVEAQTFDERHAHLQRWISSIYSDLDSDHRLDGRGLAHDPTSGRFVRPARENLRRLPIVPVVRGKGAAERLWREEVELYRGEGIVACDLRAPFGKGKRKVRYHESLDCSVVSVGRTAAILDYQGTRFPCAATSLASRGLRPGEIVEVVSDGWTRDRSRPLHPRIVRLRLDLCPAIN